MLGSQQDNWADFWPNFKNGPIILMALKVILDIPAVC